MKSIAHRKQIGKYLEKKAFCRSPVWVRICNYIKASRNYTCELCGTRHADKKGLDVHHIIDFSHVAYRLLPSNLALLCTVCHKWAHSKANTEKKFINSPPQEEELQDSHSQSHDDISLAV